MIWSRSCQRSLLAISLYALYYMTISLSNVRAHGSHSTASEGAGDSFHDAKYVHDQEHLKEHLQDAKLEADMSPEEMEFNYFKLHDLDNNTKLDGLEILRAIEHAMDHQHQEEDKPLSPEERLKKSEQRLGQYTDIIDKVFKDDDLDKDGFLSYFEYVRARKRDDDDQKAAAEASKKQ